MHPPELAEFATRRAELADQLAVERELLHLSRNHGVRVDVLTRSRSDADHVRPERVVLTVLAFTEVWNRRDPPGRLGLRRIVPNFADVIEIVVEDLDASV